MAKNTKVCIIGLGLIGGSLARALKSNLEYTVSACDTDPDTVEYALKHNIVNTCSKNLDIAAGNDIVIVCVPAGKASETINRVFELTGRAALITDVTSVKSALTDTINKNCRFVGGHPMAGKESGGIRQSTATLLKHAYYVISPSENTDAKDIEAVKAIALAAGSVPVILDGGRHDACVSAISHLPHAAAFSMCLAALDGDGAAESEFETKSKLAAGSFKDVTRIASGDVQFWADIMLLNKNCLTADINRFKNALDKISDCLKTGDNESLVKLLTQAKKLRSESISVKGQAVNTVNVEVSDTRGVIARLAKLLSDNNINIDNFAITNSCESLSGYATVGFYNFEEYEKAKDILIENGYKID